MSAFGELPKPSSSEVELTSQAPLNVLAKPQKAAYDAAVVGVVTTQPQTEHHLINHSVPPPEHPLPHPGFLLASRALTGLAGLLSLSYVIAAALVGYYAETAPSHDEGSSFSQSFASIFYILSGLESFCCLVAMAACFGLLFTRPYAVLIRNPHNGSLICLCISVVILFLLSLCSAALPIALAVSKWAPEVEAPVALCVSPVTRCIALAGFFALLVANSKVAPHDPLL